MKSLLWLWDRLLQVRQNAIRLRALRTMVWFSLRLRARALLAGGKVTLHGRAFGTQVRRGARFRVRRGARAGLVLGPWVILERGTTVSLGSGTLSLAEGAAIGARTSLEVDGGGSLIVGTGATIGVGCRISAIGRDVEIRPDARVGDYASIGSRGKGPVVVGRDASLGPRAIVHGGTTVADAALVPPHAVVEGSVGRPPAAPRARGTAPEVSVVVSTKNRAASLPALFAALARQRLPAGRFELVLVDDGSTDGTHTAARKLARTVGFPVRVVRRERSGGPAAGRNAGWRAARAPVIAFTDDDCQPAPEWLGAGLTRMRAEDADLVQGRTLPEPRQEAVGGLFVITNRVTRAGGHYETCNMFYRREVLEELDGFDERFPHPMAEDTDLALRALAAGRRAAFEPEALLYHDVRTVGWRGILRRGRNLSSHALLVKKHPGMRKVYYRRWIIKPSHAYLMIAVASVIAAVVWTPWALLGLAPYALLRFLDPEQPFGFWPRLVAIPGWVAIDAVEIGALAAASVRERRLLL